MYIAIEGVDTAGKSTQIENLKRIFKDAIFTKEPNNSKVRELVLERGFNSEIAELFIFLADRAEHIESVVKPNLDKFIFSDRSLISGVAYALVKDNLNLKFLTDLNLFVTSKTTPDRVILLWLDIEELERRLNFKTSDKIEQRGANYLFDIQSRMLEVIKELRVEHLVINASLEPEEITERILEFIEVSRKTTSFKGWM